jgi:hypothetical protein
MEQALEADAIACNQPSDSDKRGVLYGQSLTGPLPAKVDGRLAKVIVKHWGFNFTENLWVVLLDIVSTGSLPHCTLPVLCVHEIELSRNWGKHLGQILCDRLQNCSYATEYNMLRGIS